MIVNGFQLNKKPVIDFCEIMNPLNAITGFESTGNRINAHIGRFRKCLVNIFEFDIVVSDETVCSLADHPEPFLNGFLKGATNCHNFANTFHA